MVQTFPQGGPRQDATRRGTTTGELGRRITLFVNSVTVGGVEEHVLQLARGLIARGAELTLVCPESVELDAYVQRLRLAGASVQRITLSRRPGLVLAARRFVAFVRLLRSSRSEVLHVHLIGYEGGRQAVLAGWLAGVPVRVCTRHTAPEPADPRVHRWSIERIVNARLHRSIAVSEASAAAQIAVLRLPPDRMSVIANSVRTDLISYRDVSAGRASVRERLGIPAGAPVVGCVARLSAQKGICFLIAAMPEILRSVPSAQLVIVGHGDLRRELEAAVEGIDRPGAVYFVGYQEDVRSYLAAMDVFVLPSLFEGMPLSVLEAMSAGLPVVASRVGGVPELVVPSVTGTLVVPADVHGLAVAVSELLGDASLRRRMGEAARERAALFSEDDMVERTSAVYNEMPRRRCEVLR